MGKIHAATAQVVVTQALRPLSKPVPEQVANRDVDLLAAQVLDADMEVVIDEQNYKF